MIEPESSAMSIFRRLGMEKIAWALRRLYCPVQKDALVLEVGSGGNPYARANVLLDAYEETRERHWAPLVSDRPTVLGFVENLPFRDKSFDFVIASHVLEHSTDPEKFLSELQRVAKAGYIEVPDAFMERVNPYKDHRLEITVRQDKLVIRKKHQSVADETLVELYEQHAKPYIAGRLIPDHPFAFHVRYYWSKQINFEVINPETDAGWEPPAGRHQSNRTQAHRTLRQRLLDGIRRWMTQHKRNSEIDLLTLMRCPNCYSTNLKRVGEPIECAHCNSRFESSNGIPRMCQKVKQK